MSTQLGNHKILELTRALKRREYLKGQLSECSAKVDQLLSEIQAEYHEEEILDTHSPSQEKLHDSTPPVSPTPPDVSPLARQSHPIASLRLAKGWEEKLIAAGVLTILDLGKFINDGKLAPGCFPRVGREAVEKIKSAWREYVYPSGVSEEVAAKNRSAPTGVSPVAPAIATPKQSDAEIVAEGAQFAKGGYKACENPHKPGTHEHVLWDSGWQEYFATHDADDEATRELPGPEPELESTSEPVEELGYPELVLASANSAISTPPADDEFDGL